MINSIEGYCALNRDAINDGDSERMLQIKLTNDEIAYLKYLSLRCGSVKKTIKALIRFYSERAQYSDILDTSNN